MVSLLLAFLIVGMCGFCHAPEHAYDFLADDPTISRDGLCKDARERLLMATTPKPNLPRTNVHWDDEIHDWRPYRTYGSCDECGKASWRYAHETNAAMVCVACVRELRPRLWRERREGKWRGRRPPPFPRQGPAPKGWLQFNDEPIRTTRGLEDVPGPRARSTAAPSSELEPSEG